MAPTFVNPVLSDDRGEDHGDPFALRHLDEYFLYHTTADGDRGISVHRSRDLVHWEFAGFALEAGPPGHWAETDLWAPEVMYWAGTFYMYVSGTRLGTDGAGIHAEHRQGLARSDTPLGPFVLDDQPLVPDVWSIDGHPFQDEDGSLWLFYNVRTEDTAFEGRPGSGTVVDRLLAPDRLEGAPSEVAYPSARWEASFAGDEYWNEGSWVLKRRGRYHHLYSGGLYRDASYGIGVTSALSPRGPWSKDPGNPIFASGERITGPGHHSVIVAPDGVTPYAVYHAYDGGRPGRKVHLDPLLWCGDRPVIGPGPVSGRPTEGAQRVPPAPLHDPAVPFWTADLSVLGRSVTIDSVDVALADQPAPWRVRATQDLHGMRVWVDGELRRQARGPHVPELRCEGAFAARTVTTVLEDDAAYWLAPEQEHVWPWGGSGPLELALAVRGACRLHVGAVIEALISPPDRFALLHVRAPDGAEEIRVTGAGSGAQVTDLLAAAR